MKSVGIEGVCPKLVIAKAFRRADRRHRRLLDAQQLQVVSEMRRPGRSSSPKPLVYTYIAVEYIAAGALATRTLQSPPPSGSSSS